jgi:hypothetical protein
MRLSMVWNKQPRTRRPELDVGLDFDSRRAGTPAAFASGRDPD